MSNAEPLSIPSNIKISADVLQGTQWSLEVRDQQRSMFHLSPTTEELHDTLEKLLEPEKKVSVPTGTHHQYTLRFLLDEDGKTIGTLQILNAQIFLSTKPETMPELIQKSGLVIDSSSLDLVQSMCERRMKQWGDNLKVVIQLQSMADWVRKE